MFSCSDCPLVYIGRTGRKFEDRIKEHRSSHVNKKSNSTYANHLIQENHNFNDDFKILRMEYKGEKLNAPECLEINRYKRHNK